MEKTYAKFFIYDDLDSDDSIRMIDMSKKKLDVGAEFKFMEYKILNMEETNLNVSIWSSREMNEDSYLGEVNIKLQETFEKPGEWVINNKFKLSAEEYEKNVKGLVFLQVKWTPEEEWFCINSIIISSDPKTQVLRNHPHFFLIRWWERRTILPNEGENWPYMRVEVK